MTSNRGIFNLNLDMGAVLLYLALVVMGWINLHSTVHEEGNNLFFDFARRDSKQLIWIGVSLVIAFILLLLDTKIYHIFSYPAYVISIVILVLTLFFGREVNGAKAWLYIGSIGVQPVEFVKFTTALTLARYVSWGSFDIKRLRNLLVVFTIISIPVLILLLQNDMGSAIVYSAFFIALFREGVSWWIYALALLLIGLAMCSFVYTPAFVLILIILIFAIAEAVENRRWKGVIRYLATVALSATIIFYGSSLLSLNISLYHSLLISACLTIIPILIYAFGEGSRSLARYVGLFLMSLVFVSAIDFLFDNLLQIHQQKRILNLLGIESDVQNWGYNVNQSKIAIGSGGFWGKGFLEGTQTRYNFVPEQSTDFIFSTVGEEWGFVGSAIVIVLFCWLIIKLILMGERQKDPFGRVYCYSVAMIFFIHVFINIGMNVGVMPVIGIPLPLFSYGGSSFLAFTVLFIVAVKIDADNNRNSG